MRFAFDVAGALEIRDAIEQLEGLTRAKVYGPAVRAAARITSQFIAAEAPKLTGRLAASIKHKPIDTDYPDINGKPVFVRGGGARVFGAARGSGAAYGVPIEFGFRNAWTGKRIPADPFFERGVKNSQPAALDAAQAAAERSYARVAADIGRGDVVRGNRTLSVK